MATATITSKGQVTIPKKIRDKLGLKPGDMLNFELESANTVVVTAKKKHFNEAYGMLYRENQEPKSDEEINEGIVEYLKEKYKR
jgi:AbrB family looped-hinge helix DNA binding protein